MLLAVTNTWLYRHRKLLAATGGTLAVLLAALAATGCLVYRHLSDNITQVNLAAYMGNQPANLHPQAENVLLIGSGSARSAAAGAAGASSQSGSLMLVHIAADKQWAEIMSIPPNSRVGSPSCASAVGQHASRVALGAACAIKAVERHTGIYINHFIVMNDNGFKGMVAALGGVEERKLTSTDNPRAGLVLTPAQALAYAHGLLESGAISGQARVALQEALADSLITRAMSKLSDPLAAYRFLDAFTRSLTVDSQFDGITGLYQLAQTLRGMLPGNISLVAMPSSPRADLVSSGTVGGLWTQPADSAIFASFRDDVQASHVVLTAAVRPASRR
jgi:LytR_cpsA_psr family